MPELWRIYKSPVKIDYQEIAKTCIDSLYRFSEKTGLMKMKQPG